MRPRQLADAMAEGLAASGVDRIFGVPGGGPNLDMIGAAEEHGIQFVLAHGETAACIMASTYGRLTGTAGAALVTRGPGFTSAVNGLAQATLDRFPLILISDVVTAAAAPRTAHQRLDQVATARPITKWSGILGTTDPVATVRAAAQLALASPAGAVHLTFDPSHTDPDDFPEPLPVPRSGESDFETAATILGAARSPVVILGVDAVPHAESVRAQLEHLDAPIFTTYEAKGVVPESWPTFAGLFTGAALERRLLERADVILGIGLDPVEPMPGPWDYEGRVVMIHGHEVETTYFNDPLLLTGNYGADLARIVAGCHPQWPDRAGATNLAEDCSRLDWPSPTLTPQQTVLSTRKVLGDVPLAVDAGAHMLAAMALWRTDENNAVQISNGIATMGFAVPASIALALANPGRRVVCFVGDGGLGMVLAELETMVRLDLAITVVVFNDSQLTLIKLKQTAAQGDSNAIGYRPIDFATVATGLGLTAHRATTADELETALSADSGQGPVLIDAHVDADAYPHVISVIRQRST